jgi:c-di-GMP-binding flagellar brake protein YcgR
MPWSLPASALLLQTRFQYLTKENSATAIVAGAVIAGLVFVLVLGFLINNRMRGGSPKARRKYNRMVFSRMAANAGLNAVQTQALQHLLKATKTAQPFLVFSNASLLDSVLDKGIYAVTQNRELSDEDKEKRLNHYFKIKEALERSSRKGVGITSTRLIRPGQSMVIGLPNGRQFQSSVIANLKNMLACTVPLDQNGRKILISRGTKIKALFWRESDSGYVFLSKILSYDRIRGRDAVLIKHTRTLKRNQQRKFRRRPLGRNCIFYPIEIISAGGGRRQRRRAYVQRQFRHIGLLRDISAGGCSISSQTPLAAGRLLMIEFELGDRRPLTAYGKVRRLNKKPGEMGAMHIIFTKVSSANLNSIYSYVYSYIRPPSKPVIPRTSSRSRYAGNPGA